MTRPGLRTMALASVLVASIAGAACGSDPVEPGAFGEFGKPTVGAAPGEHDTGELVVAGEAFDARLQGGGQGRPEAVAVRGAVQPQPGHGIFAYEADPRLGCGHDGWRGVHVQARLRGGRWATV